MALQYISIGDGMMALGYDSITGERGILMKLTNRTGGATVKGQLVSSSNAYDKSFRLQEREFDSIGVVYDAGISDGQLAWIWVNGSMAQVLWKNSETSTRGYVALAADTDGRAYNIAVPSSNPVVGEHFKEIGHVMETKNSATDLLVLVHLHFN